MEVFIFICNKITIILEFVRSGRYYDIVHSDVKDYYDLEKVCFVNKDIIFAIGLRPFTSLYFYF